MSLRAGDHVELTRVRGDVVFHFSRDDPGGLGGCGVVVKDPLNVQKNETALHTRAKGQPRRQGPGTREPSYAVAEVIAASQWNGVFGEPTYKFASWHEETSEQAGSMRAVGYGALAIEVREA